MQSEFLVTLFAAEELARYASEDLRFTKQEQDWGGCGELAPSCGNRTPGPGDDSWKGAEDGGCHCHENSSDILCLNFY